MSLNPALLPFLISFSRFHTQRYGGKTLLTIEFEMRNPLHVIRTILSYLKLMLRYRAVGPPKFNRNLKKTSIVALYAHIINAFTNNDFNYQ